MSEFDIKLWFDFDPAITQNVDIFIFQALHKEDRFTSVWTDLNGPAKFVVNF